MKYHIRRMLSVSELAEILGQSEATVRARQYPSSNVYDPSFPKPIKLGGKTVRYYEADVLEWIETGSVSQSEQVSEGDAA